ncbi:MAG: peptidylprolyl isomerase [Candidatus Marinimicrobia bacterium]|nr:peptidylprolyl isomerase [Candidatus Neomarinimicrobiota bacterium]
MRRFSVYLIFLLLVIFSCSKKEVFRLRKGTPAYQLADELAKKLPLVDPEKDNIVAETKDFAVSAGEVINTIYHTYGRNAFQLIQFDQGRILDIMKVYAEATVEKKLLLREAGRKGISVDSTEVDSIIQIQYSRAGGEDAFLNIITNQGFTIDEVKSDISDNLKINKLIMMIVDTISVSNEELIEEYDKDRTATVRHILLSTQGMSDSQKVAVYKKMEEIREKAVTGEDFAELAKQYSEDPGSKDRGGLYENFERGKMVKEFEDQAFNTPIGEISPIFETRYGFHILKVINRKKESKPFDQVKDELESQIRNRKENDVISSYIEKLKKEAGFKLLI